MDNTLGSVRYALRQFRLSPVFTAAAVLTLAVGIGGTTAIFTLINAVMLRSLPVTDPATLYRIGDGNDCCVEGGPQGRWGMYSFPLYERLKADAPEFDQIAAFQAGFGRLGVRRQGVDQAPRSLRSEYVTGNYFTTFGVGAFGGRVFTAEDDSPSAPPVVVISHYLWQTTYGSDASVVGSTFVIEGHPFTVVGIAAPGFFGETLRSNPPDVWIPLQQEPLINNNNGLLRQPISAWLRAIGRLRPGASIAGVGPRLTGVLRQWMQNDSGYPSNWMPGVARTLSNQVITIVPAGAGVGVMKEQYGESLEILLAVCALVMLIACANVANLLLARAVARRSQTAVRLAVGATRRHLVKQALIESLLLSLAGAAAGLFVASAAARLLLSLAFTTATFLPISTAPSPLVLGFAFALAIATGVIFGTVPAWFAVRTNPIDALRGSGRTTGDHASLARTALLVVQATLSVVLVSGAAMLGRSLNKIEHQDFGYQLANRVVITLNAPPATYDMPQLTTLYRTLEARLSGLPGVQAAGLALYNPLTNNWGELIVVAGHPVPTMSEQAGASWDRVSARYLHDLGVTLVRGRAFTDNERAAPVAVVNEAFVRRFFKTDEDPLGQHFGVDVPENANTYQIVGVVRDAKFAGFALRDPARPMFFVPLAQTVPYTNEMFQRLERATHGVGGILLVTTMPAGAIEPVVTKAVADLDPNLTIINVRTLTEQVALTFDQDRAVASLAGLFGIISLVLAGVGLYGVTSYAVAQRTNEIGVRMALGADRGRVMTLVLRSAFARVAIGLILGVPLAVGAGRLIASRLYGVSFWDPLALSAAAAALLTCALVAAIIPAGRAGAIPPMLALRAD
jgi:predicted permease